MITYNIYMDNHDYKARISDVCASEENLREMLAEYVDKPWCDLNKGPAPLDERCFLGIKIFERDGEILIYRIKAAGVTMERVNP